MKKLLIILISLSCATVFAQTKKAAAKKSSGPRAYGMAGCGLGSLLMGKEDNQIFAATTNGTSGNQTFGISTGTLNCTDNPQAAMANRMDLFINANRAALTSDIARGNGETIASLTQMMGCKVDATQVGQVLQQKYQVIFAPENNVVNEITDSILQTVSEDQQLSNSCTLG